MGKLKDGFKNSETMVSILTRSGSNEARINVVGDRNPYVQLALVTDALEQIISKNVDIFRSKCATRIILHEIIDGICDEAYRSEEE